MCISILILSFITTHKQTASLLCRQQLHWNDLIIRPSFLLFTTLPWKQLNFRWCTFVLFLAMHSNFLSLFSEGFTVSLSVLFLIFLPNLTTLLSLQQSAQSLANVSDCFSLQADKRLGFEVVVSRFTFRAVPIYPFSTQCFLIITRLLFFFQATCEE